MKKTLGGERIGSGKKIKVDLHGWGRSTFNQSRIWRSTMATGPLTPCFVEWGTNGTTFNIDINTIGHTLPTNSPLFGSFKMQVDLFACPVRLYQGLLHNNAVNIGLDMSKVLLPTITIGNEDVGMDKTNPSSLLNYLGIRGYTHEMNTFSAIPLLAYYDIFKNYYANKQEENAKMLQFQNTTKNFEKIESITIETQERNSGIFENMVTESLQWITEGNGNMITITSQENTINYGATIKIKAEGIGRIVNLIIEMENGNNLYFNKFNSQPNKIYNLYIVGGDETQPIGNIKYDNKEITINLYANNVNNGNIIMFTYDNRIDKTNIVDFPLSNIDDARREILAKTQLNQRISLKQGGTDMQYLPYNANFEHDGNFGKYRNLNGLMLKTYLNDIYNCWLSTDYVDKINEISSITPNTDGAITMDALILAKKVYNVLNRIAVSGGTYEDWQESVYGENAIKRAESPIYIGGMSAEINFQEVVSTASSTNANGENQPLATLGGKGQLNNFKGGKIVYKCNEPTIIIGIASITPRIDYHQGNKWWATELMTMDDFHKPGFDGIGFQNLIANNVHWSDSPNKALAKQTAWINYQTAVNDVYGQFALDEEDDDSLYHMVLRRNYETNQAGEITDFTTYIDPSKFNYPFVSEELTAQNFWIQLGFNVKSRRKMAANEIPNL